MDSWKHNRLIVNGLIVSAIASAFGLSRSAVGQEYGLENAEAIGAFLDGSLPSTTPGTADSGDWSVVNAFPNLLFTDPIDLQPEPGTNRLYLAERPGRVYAFENDETTSTKTLLLDISS